MHKNVFIFDDIKDPIAFERFIREDVIGFLSKADGFVRLQLTYVNLAFPSVPEHVSGIQMILESYFISPGDVEALFTNPEGSVFIEKMKNNPYCKVGSYIGHEHNVTPKNT